MEDLAQLVIDRVAERYPGRDPALRGARRALSRGGAPTVLYILVPDTLRDWLVQPKQDPE